MARLVQVDKKTTAIKIATLYNCGRHLRMHNTPKLYVKPLPLTAEAQTGFHSVTGEHEFEATVGI